MTELEAPRQARGSTAKGVRRALIVLAALYWLLGGFAIWTAYHGAYQSVIAEIEAANMRSDAAAAETEGIAAADAATAAASSGRASTNSPQTPTNATPSDDEIRAAYNAQERAAARNAWLRGHTKAEAAGWNAAVGTLIGWTICFAVLLVIALLCGGFGAASPVIPPSRSS